MAPINKEQKIHGSVISMDLMGCSRDFLALVMKAPYKARDTKAADPMANPFPMAAVVFPAASRASVSFLMLAMPAISASPPALSEMGP